MLRRGLRAGRRNGRIAKRRDYATSPSTSPAVFIPVVAAVPSAPGCGIEVRIKGGASLVWPDGRALSELAQLLRLLAQ